uniref:Deoxynucleoside triphosphate triphosphohydrolase SAMHD1 n=1 Tax=Cyprinus carpio TaxID=7962 RepID=A0A8C2IZI9_CYPCA
MFRHMVEENNLEPLIVSYGLDMENDLTFIDELIKGVDTKEKDWPAKGRTEDKAFLYEIVANKRNSIDVDKWDYFARDCHYLGISKSFDHQRLLKFARVCKVEIDDGSNNAEKLSICYRDKEQNNIYDMFRTRYTLHRQAYQHKTVNIIEIMITEALVEADGHFKISKAKDNMEDYTKLTDHILEKIVYPDFEMDKKLEDARKKVNTILKRDLPKFLGEAKLDEKTRQRKFSEVEDQWTKAVVDSKNLNVMDFVVDEVHMDHSMKGNNPMNNIYFYSKHDPNKAFLKTDQMFLPMTFYERLFRVYYKGPEEKVKEAQQCFETWRSNYFSPNA